MSLTNIAALERKVAAQLSLSSGGFTPKPRVGGRYQVEALLGRSSRGLRVRATDLAISRAVALELLPSRSDARSSRELLREARALGRLEHPNVMRVYDVGARALEFEHERCEVRVVCSELIEGQTLGTWASSKKRRRKQLVDALATAARGLAAAHAAGIVHRNLGPDTIRVDEAGRVVVVRFGAEPSEPGTDTPDYLAPEARRGCHYAEADQFSFAMMAWELLTGTLPFDSAKHEYKPAGQESFFGAEHLAHGLRTALQQALEYNPSERHRDMLAFVQALERDLTRGGKGWAMGLPMASIVVTGAGVLLLGDFSAFTAPQDTPGVVSASVAPRPAPDPCSQVQGLWHFNTTHTWADDIRSKGVNDYYALQLDAVGACRFDATLRRIAPRQDARASAIVQATVRGDRVHLGGAFEFTGDERETFLEFEFDGDTSMVGAYWQRPLGQRARTFAGVLEGAREVLPRDIQAHEIPLSCPLQCVPACADEASTQHCRHRCVNGAPPQPCGAPEDPQSMPRPAAVPGNDEVEASLPPRCQQAALLLEGDWTLFVHDQTPADFSVRASGCALAFDGDIEGAGQVDGRGAWTYVGSAPDNAALPPRFALAGWGPAFGLTADGKPAAAYLRQG